MTDEVMAEIWLESSSCEILYKNMFNYIKYHDIYYDE